MLYFLDFSLVEILLSDFFLLVKSVFSFFSFFLVKSVFALWFFLKIFPLQIPTSEHSGLLKLCILKIKQKIITDKNGLTFEIRTFTSYLNIFIYSYCFYKSFLLYMFYIFVLLHLAVNKKIQEKKHHFKLEKKTNY